MRFSRHVGIDPRTLPKYTLPTAAHYLRLWSTILRSRIAARSQNGEAGRTRSTALIDVSSRDYAINQNVIEEAIRSALRRAA